MKYPSLLLLALLLPALAPAQEPAAEAGETRLYTVEVIIFRYDELESVGTEIFVPEAIEDDTGIPEFGDVSAAAPADTAEESAAELRYRPLDENEFTLQETWGRLQRLQAYEPLMHFGWVQEAVPDAETPPLALERFGTPPDGLTGTVALTLSRYLHLGIDVSLPADESALPPGTPPEDMSGAAARAGGTAAPLRYAPLRYEIRETRIMRSGETRYYDHPRFGVIARVTRAEETGADAGGR